MSDFLPNKGHYQNLLAYKVSESIYDIAFYFAHHYLIEGRDRTIDQMVQAARLIKQNIVEGSAASTTSSETELKLMNVARASMKELLEDYQDYLRNRGLEQWPVNDSRCLQTRKILKKHNDSAYYREAITKRSAETIVNIAITMIHQEDVILRRLIERLKQDFLKNGGIREQMYRARVQYQTNRTNQSDQTNQSNQSDFKQPNSN